MAAIVRTRVSSNNYLFRQDGYPVPGRDPQGFDTAIGRIAFRGTIDQLYAKFPIGGTTGGAALPDAPTGSTFYCLGPTGIPQRKWGHYFIDVTWKGIISSRNLTNQSQNLIALPNSGQYLQSISQQMSTAETYWPQDRDGATIYAEAPYVPAPGYRAKGYLFKSAADGSVAVVTEFVPYRSRIISRVYTASARGIFIGSRSTVLQPPKCMLPDPYKTDPFHDMEDRLDLPDPLYTYSAETQGNDGWVCRNYQHDTGGEYPIGDKILAFWTASYEFIRRKGV